LIYETAETHSRTTLNTIPHSSDRMRLFDLPPKASRMKSRT
jgi:hypothetical protein